MKAVAFNRVESGGGFIDDEQSWTTDQSQSDAKTSQHTARVGANLLLGVFGKMDKIEQAMELSAALTGSPRIFRRPFYMSPVSLSGLVYFW